jgi:geranylgeranyl diphosphate synthase type II
MQTLSQISTLFNSYLLENQFDRNPRALYSPIDYIMSLGGKRLRPALLMMSANLFTENVTQSLPASFAIEVFHNFSLVHDDIMDEAPLRRGQPTVHHKYGINTGILSGDVMLIYAYQYLIKEDLGSNLKQIIEIFNQVATEVCEGQQMDMDFERREDVTIQEYLRMIEFKTAVLLAGAMQIGALIGGGSQEDAKHLYAFGRDIGIAFQLQDDILDTYGDPEKFGKKVGGDIAQNKKTFLVLKALELSDTLSATALRNWLSTPSSDETTKIRAVMDIFDLYDVRKHSEALMEEYCKSAFVHLDAVSVPDAQKEILRAIANELMMRES